MTQTVPATAVLGPGLTGLTLGYRVLTVAGATYSAFTTTSVAETSVLGTYRVASGVVVPDAGGYIVFGTAATDYAEVGVDAISGYKLASDGLDIISTTAPTGVATTFPGKVMQLWHRFFGKVGMTAAFLKTYSDADGTTVVTTQAVSDSGGEQIQGKAT